MDKNNNNNMNTEYSMFHICTTDDKYSVYYNYNDNNFYGCHYQPEQTQTSGFQLNYLGLPVALFLCYLMNGFFHNCTTIEFTLATVFFFVIITMLSSFTFNKLLKKGELQMNQRLEKLDSLSKEELLTYISLGKNEFPKQILILVVLSLFILVLLTTFIFTKNIIFLLVLTIFYFITYLLLIAYRPLQKSRFLKKTYKELNQ